MKNTEKLTKFQKRNAAFKAATPERRRVLIFKDMLSQLKAKRYRPTQDTWVIGKGNWSSFKGAQVCDLTDTLNCQVCQVGGMILSTIRFVNDVKADSDNISSLSGQFYLRHGDNEDKTSKYFSGEQIRLMELAFEKGKGKFRSRSLNQVKAVDFGKKYRSNNKRMVAICKNAIKNKGTFIP